MARDFDREKMDAFFSNLEDNNRGMGSISLFYEGEEIYAHSYGYSNLEEGTRADYHTRYRVGSVSKIYTSTLILRLIEEEELSIQTKLLEFFPQFPSAAEITIEMLLRHRSGIFNFTSGEDYLNWHRNPHTREELLHRILVHEPDFSPGERTEYSNSNYVLLSMIAEEVKGKPLGKILNEYITGRLKLSDTYLYEGAAKRPGSEARSYTGFPEWTWEEETHLSVPLGAGSIVSRPTEMNIFLTALFSGQIIEENSLDLMMQIQEGFGLGLIQIPFHNKTAYGHTGGIDGFQSAAFYFPEENLSLAFTGNAIGYSMNEIMIAVLSIFYGMDYELPEFSDPLVLSEEELRVYEGEYSSPDFPLDIHIFVENQRLMGRATGQPSFPLEAVETDKFKFDQAMLEITFEPENNLLILKQGGGVFRLKR